MTLAKASLCFVIAMISVMPIELQAQTILTPDGYTRQVGALVSMMEDLKSRITRSVINLDQEATDFLLDDQANRIGALILHLAATEKYYQVYTFENRGFNRSESIWDRALSLGDDARSEFVGRPISYYLKLWDDVRDQTKILLQSRDDEWLDQKVSNSGMNNHWAWYHVMEHQANHMGQIRLITKRI